MEPKDKNYIKEILWKLMLHFPGLGIGAIVALFVACFSEYSDDFSSSIITEITNNQIRQEVTEKNNKVNSRNLM